jgi:predicted TIM-barrel fold metal-dependent hydrolase
MKAIDVHGHFGVHDRGAGGLATMMRSGDIDVVCRRAQAVDVCLTIVSALRAMTLYGGDVLPGNEDARAAAEKHDDVLFWAVLDPRLPESFEQVTSLLAHPRCAGIKIHPVNHRYDIRSEGDEIFRFAAGFDALVLTHSGCVNSFPEDFIPFANRYPNVDLILGHLGNSADGNLSRQAYALERAEHGNVYVDTSSANSINSGLIEWAVSQVGAERILFGTDTPLYFVASQKARIEWAEIDHNAKRAILYDNAARLLNKKRLNGTRPELGDCR